MKGLAKSSPFHLLTNPHVINRFIFGHGVVIYYLLMSLVMKKTDFRLCVKAQISCAVTAQLISAFVFTTRTGCPVQFGTKYIF